MDCLVKQKVSFIVGGSSGIGLATAEQLVKEGKTVRILSRNIQKLKKVEKQLRKLKAGDVETEAVDLQNFADVEKLIISIDRETRHIEHLLNAAGVFAPKTFLEHSPADYDRYMDLNRAVFFVTQSVARNMIMNGGGSIVNMGSIRAYQAIKSVPSAACSMAKAGLHSLTQHLAMELGQHGIRVNAVAPSIVVTPIYNEFIDERKVEDTLSDSFDTLHPLGRIGSPKDVANHILFLFSDKSGWTSGAVHVVDGGVLAGRR